MNKVNLVLSGGGVKAYAHLGVWKYLHEKGIEIDEVVAVSGGAMIAPFIASDMNPDVVINLLLDAKLHKRIFPFWFMPDKFEFLINEPSTEKVGLGIAEILGANKVQKLYDEKRLHIMATILAEDGVRPQQVNMMEWGTLAEAITASSAIFGIFKPFEKWNKKYIDGGHWDNCPILYDFHDPKQTIIASSLGYSGKQKIINGRVSKLLHGLELQSYSRLQDSRRMALVLGKDVILITPQVWQYNPISFDLDDEAVKHLIECGYRKAKKILD